MTKTDLKGINEAEIEQAGLKSRDHTYSKGNRVTEQLLTAIANGEYGIDGRLPAVKKVRILVGGNIMTIQGAFTTLKKLKLTNGTPGRGTFIRGAEAVDRAQEILLTHFGAEYRASLERILKVEGGLEVVERILKEEKAGRAS